MEEKIAFYYIEKGEYAPRENIPFVKRENIAAIIKYQNQYLLLSWNEVDYEKSLVTGGIEKGEDQVKSVEREVTEETGYNDFLRITKVNCNNVSRFYVEHKKQNREAFYYPYLVELASLRKDDIASEEEKEHSCLWVSEDDLDNVKIFENHRRMIDEAIALAMTLKP